MKICLLVINNVRIFNKSPPRGNLNYSHSVENIIDDSQTCDDIGSVSDNKTFVLVVLNDQATLPPGPTASREGYSLNLITFLKMRNA